MYAEAVKKLTIPKPSFHRGSAQLTCLRVIIILIANPQWLSPQQSPETNSQAGRFLSFREREIYNYKNCAQGVATTNSRSGCYNLYDTILAKIEEEILKYDFWYVIPKSPHCKFKGLPSGHFQPVFKQRVFGFEFYLCGQMGDQVSFFRALIESDDVVGFNALHRISLNPHSFPI